MRPDNANVYRWTGLSWVPVFQADSGKARLPRKANIDGFTRISAKRFYVSLSNTKVRVPGVGKVRDATSSTGTAGDGRVGSRAMPGRWAAA